LWSSNGTFVQTVDGVLFQLQDRYKSRQEAKLKKLPRMHPDNFYPADGLPEDAVLVVRTDALRNFEHSTLGDDSPFEAPFFDPDAEDYPEMLAIAVRAWEHARKGTEGTPKQRVLGFLYAQHRKLPQGTREAIAQVANWQRSGGRPANKAKTGG
jgi:hypothetical protein